jgi:hypothetical protein
VAREFPESGDARLQAVSRIDTKNQPASDSLSLKRLVVRKINGVAGGMNRFRQAIAALRTQFRIAPETHFPDSSDAPFAFVMTWSPILIAPTTGTGSTIAVTRV